HQEIPEEKLSRVAAYDWFGSIAMVPLATALAGPAEEAIGRSQSLWGCAALVVVVTAAVLFVPDVRNLTRRSKEVVASRGAAGATAVEEPAQRASG
ncbi:MFS transporter, partial [Streptomyces sp. NPDC059063]